ncbi:MAG: response regulator transcription factor [Lachnospiraceae bacterium]|nr:response regulator transcription factor [Lachnospiraceae bacterium]
MNIAIVDDEQKERTLLSSVIKEYALRGNLDIGIDEFKSAEEFLEGYLPYSYTAIFMDIFMADMTGVEAAKKILETDRHALIIFLTSSDGHMGDAFSMHAYDYIPKPAKKERIFQVIDDVLMRKSEYENTPALTITCDRKDISIPIPDIAFIQTSERNYLEIADISGNRYKTRLPFFQAEETLGKHGCFFTITRGVMVNLAHIIKTDGNVCILEDGTSLPVTSKLTEKLKEVWQNYRLDSFRSERKRRRSG